MLAWDWLYEWMIKQAAQAGFYMTSSPNITGFFYNSEKQICKIKGRDNRKWMYFPLKNWINRIIIKAFNKLLFSSELWQLVIEN